MKYIKDLRLIFSVIWFSLLLALLGCSTTCHKIDSPTQSFSSEKPLETIVLTPENTIYLYGEINAQSSFMVQLQLVEKAASQKRPDKIYLVLDTNGGSMIAGERIYETAYALGLNVTTLTIRAESMGFLLVQSLGERLILPSGYMMSHQPTIHVSGQVRSDFITRMNAKLEFISRVEQIAAHRMGISLTSYHKLVQNEYITRGYQAVKENAADRVVMAQCSDELILGKIRRPMQDDQGNQFLGVFSACPLLKDIIAIEPMGEFNEKDSN